MKRIFFFTVLAVCAISFISCLNSEYHSSPSLRAGYVTRVNAAGVCDTITFEDTVYIGDTLSVPLVLYGVYNNLTEFQVSADTSVVNYGLVNDSSYLHLLADGSAPEKGYLRFVSDCMLFETTLRYMPKKTGDYTVNLKLSSDAGEKYSPTEGYFTMLVR